MQNTPISARKGLYAQVIVWLLLIDLICASDDILSFYLDQSLHPIQVSFIRFVVNAVSVLPWMLPKGLTYFRTKKAGLHFWRGVLGAVAIGSVTISVIKMPLMKNTCLSFTEPLFLLPLAALFLKEKISTARVACSLLGMLGIVVVTYQDIAMYNFWVVLPLLSAFMFAVITVIARKMADDEPLPTLLFYFGLVTSLVLLVPAMKVWQPLTLRTLFFLTLLGINGNLVQVCMFQAFKCSDVSGFMPLRYMEALFTFSLGYLFFRQIPPATTWLGGVLILLAAFLITRAEQRRNEDGGDSSSSQGDENQLEETCNAA